MDQNWCRYSNDNFQLHRFTTSENIAKSFRGATFLTHTVEILKMCLYTKNELSKSRLSKVIELHTDNR